MHSTEELYSIYQEAVKYVAKIGAPQHQRRGGIGKLSKLKVSTEIDHQASPGAPNCWTNVDFDWVLSEVLEQRFPELAQAALGLLKKEAEISLIAEKARLRERLAKIEELEQNKE